MSLHRALVAALSLFPGILSASTAGFIGPWAPVDSQGSFINGFQVTLGNPVSNDPRYVSASLSPDNSTLTMYFVYPGNSRGSIFFDQGSGSIQPTGNVSYDWQFSVNIPGHWLVERNVALTPPPSGLGPFLNDGFTSSGHSSYDYQSGGYFSFGSTLFVSNEVWDTAYAEVILSNFVFTPSTSESVPEPASLALAALGMVAAVVARRRQTVTSRRIG